MKIENPQEMAALVAKADEQAAKITELEAAQSEFETTKTELETTKASLSEVTTEVEALRKENAEFKTALDATENVGEQVQAEVAKNVELSGALTVLQTEFGESLLAKNTELAAKDTEIIALKEQADAFAELADEYAKDKEKVQDQFALIGELLGKKALVPDVEKTAPVDEAPKSYTTWLELSLSKNPEDRRMARRMSKDNPEIDAFSRKQQGTTSVASPATSSFSAEDVAVFKNWKALRDDAEANKKNPTIHANKVVEARRLYKEHQSTIDAQINAAQAA